MSAETLSPHPSPRVPLRPIEFDVGELSDHELVEAMVEARRSASRVQAVELAAVAELARRRFAEAEDRDAVVEVLSPADYVYDEVAEALTLTATAAGGLIRFATELTEQLPDTFAALAAGDIDYLKARTMWHAIDQVDEETARVIEAKVLAKAPEQTTGQIRAKIRRLISRLDRQAADRRREEAEKRRGVELIETDDRTAHLTGVDLPADAAGAAYCRVSAIATGLKRDGDDRDIAQLRADVFLGLLRGTFTTGEPPADTTERPPNAPAADETGWTAVDDAIADVIAETARAELAALSRTLYTAHRDIHLDAADIKDLIAEAGARINRSLADRSPNSRSLTNRPRTTLTDARGEADGDVGTLNAEAGARGGGSSAAFPGALEGRHHDIGGLIAHAGARIKQSLADLRDRWCMPDPASGPVSSTVPSVVSDVARSGHASGAAYEPGRGGETRPAHGVARYRPPAAMRRLVEHRDRRCCFPGCRRPVRHCDADHTIPFHRGGPTCACNLAMLCRRHHREKATAGWHIEHLWPGVILWITPTGHWRITAPADRE